jgi:hypothetical protein
MSFFIKCKKYFSLGILWKLPFRGWGQTTALKECSNDFLLPLSPAPLPHPAYSHLLLKEKENRRFINLERGR